MDTAHTSENEEPTNRGKEVAKATGGFVLEFAAALGSALLQFLVLAVLLGIGVVLLLNVSVGLGIGFAMVSFIIWSAVTGWTFW